MLDTGYWMLDAGKILEIYCNVSRAPYVIPAEAGIQGKKTQVYVISAAIY